MKQGAQDSGTGRAVGRPTAAGTPAVPGVPPPPGSAEAWRERDVPAVNARSGREVPAAGVRGDRGVPAAGVPGDRGVPAAGVPGDRGVPAAGARGDREVTAAGARGEHTHGEASVPRPRAAVQRSSVRGQILDALRTALVSGELRPGEVYSAPALGDRFGVSATPVREAMQQLALEGAVEVVPNRGFRVVERGARELAELAEVRALVEVPVVLRLARTVPGERWAELRPLAEATMRAAASGCRATYAESDRAFHRAVLSLAGNEQLVRLAEDLHRRAQWPLVGGSARPARAELVADAAEHTALLDALIACDLDVVRMLAREHVTGSG